MVITRWEWAITVSEETHFMSVIISCKNKVENSIINQWEDVLKSCMVAVLIRCQVHKWLPMYQQLRAVIIWIKTLRDNSLSLEQYPDKLTLILESKCIKIKELSIIYKAKNKKTWTWCSIISMISTMVALLLMAEGQQLVDQMVMDADLWRERLVHKHKEECERKIISIKVKIW